MSTANALTQISGDIYAAQERFEAVLSDKSLNFEREAGFAIQVLGASDFAMKTAIGNRQSVFNAVVNVAAIGISLNPAKRQAYLVPRDGRICLDISYMGLLDLAIQSGSILWGQAELVYSSDGFDLNGFDKPPTHKRNPFSKERGEIVGAYVVVKTRDGDYLTTCMQIDEVFDIRNRSSAWKSGRSCPWKTDEGEMIKKTVIKRAYKLWPKTDRLDGAIQFLNTENGEGLAVIEEEKTNRVGVVHSAKDAMKEEYDALPIERRQVIDAVVESIKTHYEKDDIAGAYEEYTGLDEKTTERFAAWYFLPSHMRTAIKKYGKQAEAKPEMETP
jgi:recombination protein RecT